VALALAGFLARSGWPTEDETFATTAALASLGDEEWLTRQNDVETPVDRLAKALPATRIPKLSALIGDDVVSKLTAWLGISAGVSDAQYSRSVPSWPDRPGSEAFRGLAGEIVSMIEPHSEADPVALLSQLLVGFGRLLKASPCAVAKTLGDTVAVMEQHYAPYVKELRERTRRIIASDEGIEGSAE
jgi:hypothetical protein